MRSSTVHNPMEAEQDEEPGESRSSFLWLNAMPSWLMSTVVHFILLLILALITVAPPIASAHLHIASIPVLQDEPVLDFEEERLPLDVSNTTLNSPSNFAINSPIDAPESVDDPTSIADVDPAPIHVDTSDSGQETVPRNDSTLPVGSYLGSGLDGRGEQARKQAVFTSGGNDASEAAVAAALEWLANHQMPDGGWNYDHRVGPCNARCNHAGTLTDCRTGATAQALLPFLGAGQTHKTGKYKKNVEAGLYFLTQQMKVKTQMGLQCGDLAQGGGSMYSHGMAAIVLCEAYAMTHDKGLMMPAQLSLNHIVYAQDPVGGGWRYGVRTPGDTSVVGWQLMALKSGHMAYLQVPPGTIVGANKFLDSVMSDYAYYGYTDPGRGQATTAIGMLCRMYLGWKKDHPGIEKGIEYLSKTGPSPGNMYYNYYATQCMRHYEGEHWDKWNVKMRDSLVKSQEKDGHMKGSWAMKGDHGTERGGRLYCTSMATMILEVYYRHMPIYGKNAAEDEFPL
ncbi:hypothetical protein ETAA8_48920 [Anatilimnocola aggregata]|uniref:Squalene cyclase C-terminal domain-containing protein n=1 Tax=Anatilimnocola aggregata TaxID=2528021 RepID=A0A517YHQ4_9BACT|nr:hypothetical protein [Anatilimnocola aggregata]QDU29777.1 hypothetical protein ETAA8_48920 [Anatilimnocola aggregata]